MYLLPLIVWISASLPQMGELKIIEQENTSIQNILIIGDSHVVGDFGEYLHRKLYDYKKYNVTSLGIGGAGSYHFTVTMRSFCCGSKIRETCRYDSLPSNKPLPVSEVHYGAENDMVAKSFKGKLINLLNHYDPDMVIVALGSNYTNAHEELMKMIRKDRINREVVWVGPMRRSNMGIRLYAISEVIKKYPDIRFIPSDNIVGHDTITSAHLAGKSAKYWAEKVCIKLEKFL